MPENALAGVAAAERAGRPESARDQPAFGVTRSPTAHETAHDPPPGPS
jgi:hypothetical protein